MASSVRNLAQLHEQTRSRLAQLHEQTETPWLMPVWSCYRFFIVQGGKLVHKAEPTSNYTYSVDELRTHLNACVQG